MSLSAERQKEKKARDLICKALSEFKGMEPQVPHFTEDRISGADYYQKLTREGIDEGILCLCLINNMSGASGSDIDLYSLLHHYLLRKESRAAINKVLRQEQRY